MTNPKKVVRYGVVLSIFVLLAWSFVLTELHAKPGAGMERGQQYGHDGERHGYFAGNALRGLLQHQKEIGLSEDQSAKIKAIVTDYKKVRIQKEADFKLAELDVQTRVRDEKADLASIEAALKKSETARTALRLESVKVLRAATTVLTPEQKDKWHQLMKEKWASRGKEFKEKSGRTPHGSPGTAPNDPLMKEG